MFVANLFSWNRNLSLQTTANVNLSFQRASNYISSSDFDIRYDLPGESTRSDFIVILYEQEKRAFPSTLILNSTSDRLETTDYSAYDIHLRSALYDSIDFIVLKANRDALIRLYDPSKKSVSQIP